MDLLTEKSSLADGDIPDAFWSQAGNIARIFMRLVTGTADPGIEPTVSLGMVVFDPAKLVRVALSGIECR